VTGLVCGDILRVGDGLVIGSVSVATAADLAEGLGLRPLDLVVSANGGYLDDAMLQRLKDAAERVRKAEGMRAG